MAWGLCAAASFTCLQHRRSERDSCLQHHSNERDSRFCKMLSPKWCKVLRNGRCHVWPDDGVGSACSSQLHLPATPLQ